MKALIFIPVWRRVPEAKLTYKGIHRIQKVLKEEEIDSQVLVISSEPEHTELAKKEKFLVTECENFPVGQKHNCGLNYAMSLEWDYLFQMGSNNLLTDTYIQLWAKTAKENVKIFGTRKFYNILPDREHITEFKTKYAYILSGVGRGIRRDIIEECLKTGPVWPEYENKKLDRGSRLKLNVDKTEVVNLTPDNVPTVVDIRTETEDLNKLERNPKKLDKNYLCKWFPELKDLFA